MITRKSATGVGVLAASIVAVAMLLGGCRNDKIAPPINPARTGGNSGSGGQPVDPNVSGGAGGDATNGGSSGAPDSAGPMDPDATDPSTPDGAGPVTCPADKKECNGACIAPDAPCGDTCPAGRNLCNGTCVDPASVTACGSACTTCPTSPNGTASCDGDKCDLTCKPGFHKCGDDCVVDTDVATCGTSCTPCTKPTAGTATCDGKMCGAMCPADTKLCGDACIGANAPCMGTCVQDKHPCAGLCVANNDVNSCGTSCMPCVVPSNGTATCDGNACNFTCKTGFHKCGQGADAACKANTSIMSCGVDSCTACPMPANGVPICDGTACGTRCNTGFHKCGTGAQTECKPNNNEMSCGMMCTPCEGVANGRPICANAKCDTVCNQGFHKCGAQCIPNTQACGNMCGQNFKFCENKCVPTSSLTVEICDKRDNDCNGVVDDVAPIDCPANACTRGGKKICNKNTGTLDESACKPGPQPGNSMACGQVGGNKCEICAQGSVCVNGVCAVNTCPNGQRVCASQNKCIANDALCDGKCSSDFQLCDGKCIGKELCCKTTNPNCCVDNAGCGKCEKCVARQCVPQVNEDVKSECPDGTQNDCNSGLCSGKNACGFKPQGMNCGQNGGQATCNQDSTAAIGARQCSGTSGNCPAGAEQKCDVATKFCQNGTCSGSRRDPGQGCSQKFECKGNVCGNGGRCCTGSDCGQQPTCGTAGQPCCTGRSCPGSSPNAPLACVGTNNGGLCAVCGTVGNDCCPAGTATPVCLNRKACLQGKCPQ